MRRRIFVDNVRRLLRPARPANRTPIGVTVAAHRLAAAASRAIDVDLHHQIADWSAVAPVRARRACAGASRARADRRWPATASTRAFGDAQMPAASIRRPIRPSVKEHYLDPRGVDVAILTGSLLSLGVQPNPDLAAAIASARQRLDARHLGPPVRPATRARSWSRSRTRRRRSPRSTAWATIRAWSRC